MDRLPTPRVKNLAPAFRNGWAARFLLFEVLSSSCCALSLVCEKRMLPFHIFANEAPRPSYSPYRAGQSSTLRRSMDRCLRRSREEKNKVWFIDGTWTARAVGLAFRVPTTSPRPCRDVSPSTLPLPSLVPRFRFLHWRVVWTRVDDAFGLLRETATAGLKK